MKIIPCTLCNGEMSPCGRLEFDSLLDGRFAPRDIPSIISALQEYLEHGEDTEEKVK